MGVPRAFQTDSGLIYMNWIFAEYCDSLAIRRKLTAPSTLQQNTPAESDVPRTIKAGLTARSGVNDLFPDVHLERVKGVSD